MKNINLHEKYGRRYRIGWDQSRSQGCYSDPQLMTLIGRRGHIYVDGDQLCAACDGSTQLSNVIKKIPQITVLQDGDDGINFKFPEELFNVVAKIIKLYRRKKMSEATKEKLREILKKAREVKCKKLI